MPPSAMSRPPVAKGRDRSPQAQPVTQRALREHNRALVLGAIAEAPGLTRAQIASRVGLTRATLSTLVEQLLAADLLVELDPAPGLRGRPGSPLELNPAGPAAIGLEIDVDRISGCLVDLSGVVRATRTLEVDNSGSPPAVVLRRAARLIDKLVEAAPAAAGVAIAFPGLIDGSGTVLRAPNLPLWEGTSPVTLLRHRTAAPVVAVDNEANLAALAERSFGGRLSDFVYLSGEIGVGGAVVLDGDLFRGVRGFAGEVGHIVVDPLGQRCGCGNRGCLEQEAGRAAILRRAGARDEEQLVARARARDQVVLGVFEEIVSALAIALTAVLNTLDLPAVILGGCYARLGEWLASPLERELRARIVSKAEVEVRISQLAADAPMLGAASELVRAVIAHGAVPAWS